MSKRRAKGEGTLAFDEARGLWVGRVPASVDPRRRAVYAKTQEATRAKLRRAIRDAEVGLIAMSENSPLGLYLDQWLDVIRARVEAGTIAPSTAAGVERDVRLALVPMLGRIPLRKLTPANVEAMFGKLRARGLSPKTIRHVRGTLSKALSDAVRDQLIEHNVARLVTLPQLPRRAPSAFTLEEMQRISKACERDRLGPLSCSRLSLGFGAQNSSGSSGPTSTSTAGRSKCGRVFTTSARRRVASRGLPVCFGPGRRPRSPGTGFRSHGMRWSSSSTTVAIRRPGASAAPSRGRFHRRRHPSSLRRSGRRCIRPMWPGPGAVSSPTRRSPSNGRRPPPWAP